MSLIPGHLEANEGLMRGYRSSSPLPQGGANSVVQLVLQSALWDHVEIRV